MIVKVQRPLVGSPTNAGQPEIMVYAEGHEHQVLMHWKGLPRWLQAALGRTPKVYAEATWTAAGWQFVKVEGWQPW